MSASPGPTAVDLSTALNPFDQRIVPQAWVKAPADVAEINENAFRKCIAAIEQSRRSGASNAIILHGETGSGKTHLLSRLREAIASTEPSREPVFVYVMLAAGASRLRRLVRESFVDSLLRPWRDQPSRLAGLLREITQGMNWHDVAASLRLSHRTETVLGWVLEGRFRTATTSWLRGESLPDDVLAAMGVKESPSADETDEESQGFETIRVLCRLAEPRLVVFCCDQAEALRASINDNQGFFTYGQMGAAIRNSVSNAVLITSIQTVLLSDFRNGMHEADYNRLGEPVALEPLSLRQGQLLLKKRLDAEPSLASARSRRRDPGLWPLDEQKLKTVYDQGGRTAARRLLYRAAELFEAAREQKLPDEGPIDSYLDEKLHELRRTSKAWQSPAQTDAILEHGFPVLASLLGHGLETVPPGNRTGVNFKADGAPISLCSQENQTAFSRRLSQLAASGQKGVVLVRDVRLEIRRTPKAAIHMETLTAQQARWVRPTAEALAALEALQRLHDGYGTLSHQGESVSQATVADWLRDNLPDPLKRLAEEFFEAMPEFPAERLMDRLGQELVVDLKEAAEGLRVTPEELIAYAHRRPDQVLLVGGPSPLLCLVVGEKPQDLPHAG